MSRADWPLDRALECLRAHGLPYRGDEGCVDTWRSVCPSCRVAAWTLTIREHGRGGAIDLRCSAGCDPADVARSLEQDPLAPLLEAEQLRAAEALDLAGHARDVASRALALASHSIDHELRVAA